MWLIIKQAAPGKATKKKPMGHELFEALPKLTFFPARIAAGSIKSPKEREDTDRTTEEMEGRTAKTKVIIKRSQDSGSGSRIKS